VKISVTQEHIRMTSPVEIPLLCESQPVHAPAAAPEFHPLTGTGPDPDLELPSEPFSILHRPSSLDAPACLLRPSDRSQHFHNFIEAEIGRLETRLQELKDAAHPRLLKQ
jgi:hypothetical protein